MLTAYLAGLKAFLYIVGGLVGFLTVPIVVMVGAFLLDRARKRRRPNDKAVQ